MKNKHRPYHLYDGHTYFVTGRCYKGVDYFREENKKLFEYFSSLSPDLKERFKLIWLRKRPEQHYLIIDRKSMVFESKHKEGEPREIYCVLENKKEAEKFLVFYNQLIKAKGEYLFVNSGNKQ